MKKATLWLIAAAAALLLLVACGGGGESESAAPAAPAAPAATIDPSQTGSLAGTISLADGADPDTVIKMDADPVCAGLHSDPVESETRITDDAGNLSNVFVYIKSGLSGSFPAPAEPAVLNQKGCLYEPHVGAVQVGQALTVRNSDETLHNVHATPAKNAEFNQAQPFQGMELERTFDQEEVMIPFKCDVHPWMQSYLAVVGHPFFAVTGGDGSFSINGIPAGTYTVGLWHELLGTQEAEVTIEAGGTADLSMSYGG